MALIGYCTDFSKDPYLGWVQTGSQTNFVTHCSWLVLCKVKFVARHSAWTLYELSSHLWMFMLVCEQIHFQKQPPLYQKSLQNLEGIYGSIEGKSPVTLMTLLAQNLFYTILNLCLSKWVSIIILSGSGSGDSGVYRKDPVHARDTKFTGNLHLSLLYLASMFGEDLIYGVWVMTPPKLDALRKVLSEEISGAYFLQSSPDLESR